MTYQKLIVGCGSDSVHYHRVQSKPENIREAGTSESLFKKPTYMNN